MAHLGPSRQRLFNLFGDARLAPGVFVFVDMSLRAKRSNPGLFALLWIASSLRSSQ
jgi:hypothetical protein